ncbi:MAG: acetyl-CoA carboxylase carboxyltransferase subunit beta [Chloroflexi bacterium]|nr:acetyl-CoA carboxylase carboxyltransferase subunit beta [Chloroflexota bacterium]
MKNLTDLLTAFVGSRQEEEASDMPSSCPSCKAEIGESEKYRRLKVCEVCGHHFSLSARERIELLVDPGSFKETNRSLTSVDPLSFSDRIPYRARLKEAQKKTGLTDAVVTGTCHVAGIPAVIAVLDFEFLGGSMGSVVGEKIARAFELAVKKKLPIVTVATSGGARMQEGMLSLMQMAKTAAAVKRLHVAKLPFVSILANPTTGGIYASFANLADIIVAEPKALIGFAGPRVIEQTMGNKLPAGSHTAEFLLAHGMVDMLVERGKHRHLIVTLLDLLGAQYRLTRGKRTDRYEIPEQPRESVWDTVQIARHTQRPTSLDYISRMMSSFVELHGDRLFGDDGAVVCGLADLSGEAVVVVGQERGHGEEDVKRNQGRAYPEGYRKAQRAMNLAAKFGLPVITFVDTPGAYPGLESEERGIAMSLASSLALMSDLPTPILSAIIGEGGSGGALALGLADRVYMLENAIYSVIAPEGAAAILYRDAAKAPEVAPALKMTAYDCKLLGVVDMVVPEPPGGTHLDHDGAARQLKTHLLDGLLDLRKSSPQNLVKARYEKYRRIGEYNSYFRSAVAREISVIQEGFQHTVEQIRERLPRRGGDEEGEDEQKA